MKSLYITIAVLLSSFALTAQTIEDELGFIYVKADYLLGTDRYEEAIQEFTKIIAKDPKYKDVLYKRAKAKYAIAAFLGTKKDLLQAFDVVGISPESIELYGKALKNLDQHDAASKTLETASMIKGGSGNIQDRPRRDTRTEPTSDDTKSDMEKLEDKLGSILEDLLPDDMKKTEEKEPESPNSDVNKGNEGGNNDGDADGDVPSGMGGPSDTEEEVVEEEAPDMSVNEIYIDEDLTLEIKNGIGGRRILEQPNILILSDRSGDVHVDVCVNENGKVTSAEFNKNESSISTQSLVSLAVRKSKEFWFEKSNRSETCGSIVFKISGRS